MRGLPLRDVVARETGDFTRLKNVRQARPHRDKLAHLGHGRHLEVAARSLRAEGTHQAGEGEVHSAGIQVAVGVAIRDLINESQVLLAARIRDRLQLHDLADARGPPTPHAVQDPPDDANDDCEAEDPHPVRVDDGIQQVVFEFTGHVRPFRERASGRAELLHWTRHPRG